MRQEGRPRAPADRHARTPQAQRPLLRLPHPHGLAVAPPRPTEEHAFGNSHRPAASAAWRRPLTAGGGDFPVDAFTSTPGQKWVQSALAALHPRPGPRQKGLR